MKICVYPTATEATEAAALLFAEQAIEAVRAHGRCVVAVSGGKTPEPMFRSAAQLAIPWTTLDVFQVDERVVDTSDSRRNAAVVRETWIAPGLLPSERFFPMPVESADIAAGARQYARLLENSAGSPPTIDLVHLGLGDDGHTASLVPGDSLIDDDQQLVGLSVPYQGVRRMTLMPRVLNRSSAQLWLVLGTSKAMALRGLWLNDRVLPATHIDRARATVIADLAAAAALPAEARDVDAREPASAHIGRAE